VKQVLKLIKNFIKEEDGLGTIEIVIIIAVLIAIALIFRKAVINFVKSITDSIFGDGVKGQVLDGVTSPAPT